MDGMKEWAVDFLERWVKFAPMDMDVSRAIEIIKRERPGYVDPRPHNDRPIVMLAND